MANLLWLVRSRSGQATACWILRFRHYMTCPRDRTSGGFPSDSIFYQLVLCDSADPLTVHSYLLHTLHVFVDMRGIISEQSVLLPSTHSSDCRSSNVDHIMRRRPTHLPQPVSGAQRSPLTCPANRVRWPAPPQRIRCCKVHSIDTGLWCWDATPQVASDDTPSQRGGWRGRLSVSFEVRACQGRITLASKSLEGVHAPNTRSPPSKSSSGILYLGIESIFALELHIVGVKTTSVYLSTDG